MELKQITRLAYLIAHRLTITLSIKELEELERWLNADKQNRQLLEDMHRRNFYTEKQIEEYLYDSMSAFQKVSARRQQQLRRRRSLRIWRSVAAVAVLLIGTSLAFLYRSSQVELLPVRVAELSAGESRAILTLGNGQRMELTGRMSDSVFFEEGIRLNATGVAIQYDSASLDMSSSAYNTLEVPRKGEFQLLLADGTKVWINSESRIKYPVSFNGRERRVYLEGEAYFEVSKNERMPFVVDMGKAEVRVLGTSFNARAYRDEDGIYATLAEGRICLDAGGKSLNLLPEEQGLVDLVNGNMSKKRVDIHLYTAWKDGRFVFQEQKLEDMMNTLARWYDIEIFFESELLKQVTFTGNLKRYDSFNKIIELLEMTQMAHFKVDGNTIFISK